MDRVQKARILKLNGRLPLVREVDPISVGVHPAPLVNGDRLPAYVPRDIDVDLRAALRTSGFVLVVGEATAGKSRAAYEAMRAVLPDHELIAPTLSTDITQACDLAQSCPRFVLWLDDLQAFLMDGGLTRADVATLLNGGGHHRVILATIRAVEESLITGGLGRADPLIRVSQGVLEQVGSRVFVERLFSRQEREWAAPLAQADVRLSDALRRADHDGIGEYLAWGPQLFSQWQAAWTRGAQPRAAALIAAAVDCRRAGYTGPLPRRLLVDVHEEYLIAHGGARLNPEDLVGAWEWALEQRPSGSAPLLEEGRHHVDVFDYLIDEYRRRHGEQVPERTVRTALEFASAADAESIADTALQQERFDLTREALVRQQALLAEHGDLAMLLLRVNLTLTTLKSVRYATGLGAAEGEFREIITALERLPVNATGAALQVRVRLANLLFRADKLAEAESEYREVVAVNGALYGPDHASTLMARHNLAVLLTETNQLREAFAEFTAVYTIRMRTLGPDHPDTRLTASNLAAVVRRLSPG